MQAQVACPIQCGPLAIGLFFWKVWGANSICRVMLACLLNPMVILRFLRHLIRSNVLISLTLICGPHSASIAQTKGNLGVFMTLI